MATQSYQCVHTKTNTWAHSSKSNVDVMILHHILINANPCCILRYKFHVFKLYIGFRRYGRTKLPMCTKTCLFRDLQLQLWWGCHYAWTCLYKPQSFLYQMVQSFMSVKGRVQEMQSQIYPCASISKIVYFMGSQLHIWWGCHDTFTYRYKLQSLLHPTVRPRTPPERLLLAALSLV